MRIVNFRHVCRIDRPSQDFIEGSSSEMNCERNFLPFLCPPAGSIHHPKKEVGLDPAHTIKTEFAAKLLILSREDANGRTICLVMAHHRVRIKLRENVLPRDRPALQLVQIWFLTANFHFVLFVSALYSRQSLRSIRQCSGSSHKSPAVESTIPDESRLRGLFAWCLAIKLRLHGETGHITRAAVAMAFQSRAICRACSLIQYRVKDGLFRRPRRKLPVTAGRDQRQFLCRSTGRNRMVVFTHSVHFPRLN